MPVDTARRTACVERGVLVIRVDCHRLCQVFPEDCVHIGERALALNFRLRRHRAVTCRLLSNPARPHSASLRPFGLAGFTAPAVPPVIWQLRDGRKMIGVALSSGANINDREGVAAL